MTVNRSENIHIFTTPQLKEHDRNVARAAADAATKRAARRLTKMTQPQQLQSLNDDCKSLKLSDDVLDRISEAVLEAEKVN